MVHSGWQRRLGCVIHVHEDLDCQWLRAQRDSGEAKQTRRCWIMTSKEPDLVVDLRGRVLVLRINRPEARNALSPGVITGIGNALRCRSP